MVCRGVYDLNPRTCEVRTPDPAYRIVSTPCLQSTFTDISLVIWGDASQAYSEFPRTRYDSNGFVLTSFHKP